METKKCIKCGTEYSRNGQGKKWFESSKFCSWSCRSSGKDNPKYKERPKVYCKGCGKEIQFPETGYSYYRVVRRLYCSNSCKTRELHQGWKGGRFKIDKGYIKINVGGGKSQYEHILIAEKAIGRNLKQGEVVHHVNGRKDDNRNCNLLICDNTYHRWLHEEMARLYQKEHFVDTEHLDITVPFPC